MATLGNQTQTSCIKTYTFKVMKLQDAKAAEKNPKIIHGRFDIQAVLTLPFSGDCQIYYKRKLPLFNFTIFNSI